MNSLATVSALILCAGVSLALPGATLTAPPAVFFGRVIHVGQGPSHQVYAGELLMELVRDDDPSHVIFLSTPLGRIGLSGELSYRLEVPLRHQPEPHELSSSFAVEFKEISYSVRSITVDGQPALPVVASQARVVAGLASPAPEYPLDIEVNLPHLDSDGDGMPDEWEQRYGLNPRLASDATRDLDGDGLDNFHEWLNASDPTTQNFAPLLQTTSMRVPAGGVAGFHVSILDMDTAPSELKLKCLELPEGLTLLRDAVLMRAGDEFRYSDVLEGRVRAAVSSTFVSGSLVLSIRDDTPNGVVTGAVAVAAFSPATEVGLSPAAWLEPSSLSPMAPVSEWSDRSGNQRDAYQPLAGAQPMPGDGAMPAVEFENNAYLYLDQRELNTSQCTVFMAFQAGVHRAAPQTVLRIDPMELAIDDTGGSGDVHSLRLTAGERIVRGPAIVPGRGEQLTLSAGPDGLYLRTASGFAAYSTQAAAMFVTDTAYPTIGATHLIRQNSAKDFFDGLVREVMIYAEALDPFAITANEDYLASRWGSLTVWDARDQTVPITARGCGSGPNALTGGWGPDDLTGGPFADVLRGGPGDDRLTGDGGADRFQFFGDHGNDTVTDFNPDEGDVLDLTGVFGGQSGNASDYLRARHIVTRNDTAPPRADVIIELDHDGVLNGWTTHQVIQLENVRAASLARILSGKSLWLGGLTLAGDQPGSDGHIPDSPAPADADQLGIELSPEGLKLTQVMSADQMEGEFILQHSPDLRTWTDVTAQFEITHSLLGGNLVLRTWTKAGAIAGPTGYYRILVVH